MITPLIISMLDATLCRFIFDAADIAARDAITMPLFFTLLFDMPDMPMLRCRLLSL